MNATKFFLCITSLLIFITMPAQATAGGTVGFTQLVQWKGTGVPVELPAGVGGNVVPAGTPCYEVPMVMPQTGVRLGTGFDCISNPGSLPIVGEGSVTTYYIFAFLGRGSIISENRVVVRIAEDYDEANLTSLPFNTEVTHILGSFPTDNTIVGGTRRFENTEGKVRVSGAVSLANFPNEIVFDDLFVIDFK